jgi:hypothetical protein
MNASSHTLIINSIYTSTSNQAIMTSTESSEYWADVVRKSLLIAGRLDAGTDTEESIDEAILTAPRRGSSRDALAWETAARLYPDYPLDSLAPIIQYEKDIVKLRSLAEQHRKDTVAKATEYNEKHNWLKRILKQNGPWDPTKDSLSYKGAPSTPMPVEVSDPKSLAPFFTHLRNNGTHQVPDSTATDLKGESGAEPYYNVDYIEFEKGVLYSDGRIDLCKMVTGPRNIGDLMESLETNEFSKHFLLGNNIIGPTGAEAIASFIEAFPNRIETWYLAGNCIDAPSFTRLVDAMIASPITTNIWLKRNPLGPTSAQDLFRLITQSPSLRTLDLDQTELGDEGVATLFSLLTTHNQPLPLRHIYLNATGVGPLATAQLSAYLSTPSCSLSSLYLANNPLGPSAALLAPGLAKTTTLTRLSLQSCGLSDAPVATLLSALQSNPNSKISALDFGQSYATEDLQTRYNWLTTASPFADFVSSSATLRYLNISLNSLSQTSINTLLTAVSKSASMLYLDRTARPLIRGLPDHASVKAGQEAARLTRLVRERLRVNVQRENGVGYEEFEAEHKRFLVSPRDVRLIDSVYRNREAGMAKRGEGRLKKLWEEGDETLRMVVGEGVKVAV